MWYGCKCFVLVCNVHNLCVILYDGASYRCHTVSSIKAAVVLWWRLNFIQLVNGWNHKIVMKWSAHNNLQNRSILFIRIKAYSVLVWFYYTYKHRARHVLIAYLRNWSSFPSKITIINSRFMARLLNFLSRFTRSNWYYTMAYTWGCAIQ